MVTIRMVQEGVESPEYSEVSEDKGGPGQGHGGVQGPPPLKGYGLTEENLRCIMSYVPLGVWYL